MTRSLREQAATAKGVIVALATLGFVSGHPSYSKLAGDALFVCNRLGVITDEFIALVQKRIDGMKAEGLGPEEQINLFNLFDVVAEVEELSKGEK